MISSQEILFSFAYSLMAFASGCSLFCSNEAASVSSCSSVIPSAGRISVTTGSPFVTVPVLSNAITWILPAISKDAAVLYKIPLRAPTPFPTIMATGVASPNAHGQLITNTEIPLARAYPILSPKRSQIIMVINASTMTAGTKKPDTVSATFAIGAFVEAASLTICIICDNVVSSPTLVASQRKNPD